MAIQGVVVSSLAETSLGAARQVGVNREQGDTVT
jgi:hypothetical protein